MICSEKDTFDIKPSTEISDGTIKFHNASATWKVVNFSRRARKADEELKSPELTCSDATWVLSVYPNGQRSDNTTGEVVIHLNKISSATLEHKAVVEITVLREEEHHKCGKTNYTFFGNESVLKFQTGLRRNVVLSKDHKYLPDNILTINCNLFVFETSLETTPAKNLAGEDSSVENDRDAHALSKDFETLYNDPRFTDVVLKLGEQEFHAHKAILRCRSKVFDAMFEHDMKENRQDSVDLVEMEVNTVKSLLCYIYCGKVHQLSSNEALNLYVAADRYDLKELVSKCRNIVLDKLALDTMGEVSVVANLHEDQVLLDAVISLLSKDLKNILRTDKWKIFAKENPNLSLNLIQSAILND